MDIHCFRSISTSVCSGQPLISPLCLDSPPTLTPACTGREEFARRSTELSAAGYANTLRGVPAKRPPVYALEKPLRRLRVPLLLVTGDEDDKCLEPGIFIKRVCPAAGLVVVPWSGHVVNLEEPDFFNRLLLDFLTLVDSGRWRPRDPRSTRLSVLANKG